jgi:SAM-dependent methyltransferase
MTTTPSAEAERKRLVIAYGAVKQPRFFGLEDHAHHRRFNGRNEVLLRMLARHGVRTLSGLDILDFGCGDGQMFPVWISWGAAMDRIVGTDVRPDVVDAAKAHWPTIDMRLDLPGQLSAEDRTFDFVAACTVFSSVVNTDDRAVAARNIDRVSRPGALVVMYDFVVPSPTNSEVRPVRLSEIRALFPGWQVRTRRTTLAPLVTRRIPPSLLGLLEPHLEVLRVANTHRLTVLRKPGAASIGGEAHES